MLNLLDPDTKPTLLVVDDTPENLSLLSALLSPHYRVKVAISGQRALEILSAGTRVDLILLDVVMPQMDGYQVMQALQEMPQVREIPVIFLSALDQIEDKAQGFAAGGVDYVTKPFDARELLLRVRTHLRIGQQLAALRRASPPPGAGDRTPGRESSPDLPPLLVQARDLLLADPLNPPDPATLAGLCHTNRTYLQGLFKAHLGLSIVAYLREQRLHRFGR